jgi:pimeloyl-ACP methyl ester carboxylesterase
MHNFPFASRRLAVPRLLVLVVLSLAVGRADAQTRRPGAVQRVEIATADGVQLKGDFYPSGLGKKAPVAVLLADEGQSRASLARLAQWLQRPAEGDERPSFAVLTIDLRGQGDSTVQRLPSGATRSLSGAKSGPADIDAMIRVDMEAVRRHLVTRNDLGELNLNRLAFVGVGSGAMVAACAAAVDWSAPQLAVGKQGKDVKALVLVSPPWKHKGAAMLTALRQPGVQSQVATMVMYGGEDRTATADAQRIVNQLLRARPKQLPPTKTKLPSVFDVPAPTKLQGDAWLKQMGENGEELIGQFLEQYVAKPDYPWVERRVK